MTKVGLLTSIKLIYAWRYSIFPKGGSVIEKKATKCLGPERGSLGARVGDMQFC